ncbi:MAG TPA: ECF transporter S component, partial [Chloroflexaceae bacterium]|nr:ECF transporter S component [Chloroflexaceae bacterium]
AFLYPFFLSAPPEGGVNGAHGAAAPFIFAVLGPALLALLVAELSGGRLSTRSLAILGVLTALVAALRLPAGPGDAPTFFFLIILAGYVYGGVFGFLLGALGLFVSAIITGGVGPWMPFQMFVTGWMGLGTALLVPVGGRLRPGSWAELLLLAAYGYLWGLLFGAMMNLWFWPFSPPGALAWSPGLGLGETLRRYGAFYLLTSFAWDSARALGNAALILVLGRPVLKELRRFKARFSFTVEAPEVHAGLEGDLRS